MRVVFAPLYVGFEATVCSIELKGEVLFRFGARQRASKESKCTEDAANEAQCSLVFSKEVSQQMPNGFESPNVELELVRGGEIEAQEGRIKAVTIVAVSLTLTLGWRGSTPARRKKVKQASKMYSSEPFESYRPQIKKLTTTRIFSTIPIEPLPATPSHRCMHPGESNARN